MINTLRFKGELTLVKFRQLLIAMSVKRSGRDGERSMGMAK